MMKIAKIILRISPFFLAVIAVLINLWVLRPETTATSELNDNVFAFTLVQKTNDEWQTSGCPLMLAKCVSGLSDFWVSTWATGFPLPHSYQHVPHLVPVIIYNFLSLLILHPSLFGVFEWFKYLLLSAFPLSIYWAARKLELGSLAAGLAALLSPMIATQYLYGTDFNAVVWRGSGMYTQLWGFVVAPLAIGSLYDTIRYRRSIVRSALLLALVFASHLIFGYIVVLSTPIMVLSIFLTESFPLADWKHPGKSIRGSLVPLTLVLGLVVTLTFVFLSYWAVPLVVDNTWDNSHSLWDDRSKFDSYGALAVTQKIINGDVFDANRLPVMTTLVFGGIFVALIKFLSSERKEQLPDRAVPVSHLFLPLMFGEWYLLYWGRASWGPIIDVLPMVDGIHIHRFINGLHFAGIFLMGIGLAWLISKLLQGAKVIKLPRFLAVVLATAVTIVILWPIYQERFAYLSLNAELIRQANGAFLQDESNFVKTVNYLKANEGGRIWVGRPGNWGNNFNVGETHAFMQFSMAGIDVSGFLPETWSPNSDVEQFFDETRIDHYQALGIKTLVAPGDHIVPEGARKVAQFGKFVIYDLPEVNVFEIAMAPFKLVSSKKEDLSVLRMWLESSWPAHHAHPFVLLGSEPPSLKRLQTDVITMKNLSDYSFVPAIGGRKVESDLFSQDPFKLAAPATPSGEIVSARNGLNHFETEVSIPGTKSTTPLYIVLKASYHPYWKAMVDNRPAEIFPVAPVFMAVPLPPCKQTTCRYKVDFVYQATMLKKTLLLVSLGAVTLALAFRKRLDKLPFLRT